MNIAFLNLCHCEPDIVARVSRRLTQHEGFDMYIHVDLKTDWTPYRERLASNRQVTFIENRHKVYWGGYNAVNATVELLQTALRSDKHYDYFVLLQNLDYPIRSNTYIANFFRQHQGTEFIRGCNIAQTKDWHYSRKYKLYNSRDDDFYLKSPSKASKYARYLKHALQSITTIGFNGIIREHDGDYAIHYGAAQWAITRECAEYIVQFEASHPRFNQIMKHIQFPDEEYFHTIVHNSEFKFRCVKYDEPEQRWLVNWRNLHYFEFPKAVTVFGEQDYEKIMKEDVLFVRKVKSGISDMLMDKIDEAAGG